MIPALYTLPGKLTETFWKSISQKTKSQSFIGDCSLPASAGYYPPHRRMSTSEQGQHND